MIGTQPSNHGVRHALWQERRINNHKYGRNSALKARFIRRLILTVAAMSVAAIWAGAATAVAQTQTDTTFSGGTPDANTEVFAGDLALNPDFDVSEEFDGGPALPVGWESVPWGAGGTATVAGGAVTVDGARANTTTGPYASGRSLDFAATFTADPFQHVGLGTTLEGPPWAIFSTGGGDLPLGFYARSWAPGPAGGVAINTPLAIDHTVEHDYGIEWTPTEVRFFVDGDLVATHANSITAQMRPIASDFNVGGGNLDVAFLDLYSYPASGTFTSRVFDAGDSRATWRSLIPTLDTPAGTGVSFAVRTGSTPTPDASWTGFQPVGSGGQLSGPLGRRYLQYRATLTTTDSSATPFVEDVTLGYQVDTAGPTTTISGLTTSGRTARLTFTSEAGATFQCSLDNGPFQACTSPKEYSGLSRGSHRVRVRAIDQFGNVGPAAQRTFTIGSTSGPPPPSQDNTAPRVRPRPRSVVVSQRGRFKLRLRCPSTETRCHIALRVRYKGRTAAFKRVTVDGGDRERVTLRLRRYARIALRNKGRLRVRAFTTARDPAGNRATTRTRLKLRLRR